MSTKKIKRALLIVLIICLIISFIFIIINKNKGTENRKDTSLIKSEIINEKETQPEPFSIRVQVSDYIINSILIENTYYLFIPNNVDISNLILNYNNDIESSTFGQIDKQIKTILCDFTQNNEVILTSNDSNQYKIKVMQSDVPSICINVNNSTLEEINGGTKDEKYEAKLQVLGADKEIYNITDKTIELKGRGNSTWLNEKKPYQIKFEEKENILGINGKAKKWILLANYNDRSLLKNQLSFDLQKDIGLSDSINGMFVDLYINGEFLGNYTLCDKIDIEETRVNLTDPNGIIAELDNAYDNVEPYKFKTKLSSSSFVIKESVSKEETEEFQKRNG